MKIVSVEKKDGVNLIKMEEIEWTPNPE